MAQLVTVLKPLQVVTTVLSLEQNPSCSILYPVTNDLLLNHLTVQACDIAAIKTCKRNITDQLNKKRYKPSSLETAKTIPDIHVCADVDPRFTRLVFLSTKQREITQQEVLDQVESFELDELAPTTSSQEAEKSAIDFLLENN